MIVKAHVSPAFRAKTRPQTEQRSKKDHPENRRPSPQCGQRLRRPRPSAVAMNFQPPGVKRKSATNREDNGFVSGPDAQLFAATFFYSTTDFGDASIEPTSVSSHFVRLNLCSLQVANEFTTVSKLSEPEGRPGGRDRRVHLLSVFKLRGRLEHSRTSRHAARDDRACERA